MAKNTDCGDFTIESSNPYATTPPHVIGTITILTNCEPVGKKKSPHVRVVDCGHVDMIRVGIFGVFIIGSPEGRILLLWLEPARMHGCCPEQRQYWRSSMHYEHAYR